METDTVLSRREATLRSAATASLAGIALVQAIELPSLLAQGRQPAVLALAAMALCVGLGWTLAAAPAAAAPRLWRAVAATGAVLLGTWAAARAFGWAGPAGSQGDWAAMPAAAAPALAVVCLLLALAAVRPALPRARTAAIVAALLFATTPGVAALRGALAPGAAHNSAQALAMDQSMNGMHMQFENKLEYRPGKGRHGGHYVLPVTTPPHPTALGLALLAIAALMFISGALGSLRRRCAPVALRGPEASPDGGASPQLAFGSVPAP